jgi:hypothetical protein
LSVDTSKKKVKEKPESYRNPQFVIGVVDADEEQNVFDFYSDKKENKIFLTYKEIQIGSVAKSYMRKGFLKYEEMSKYLSE